MTLTQQIITVAMCVIVTLFMRALPFAVFSSKKPTPKFLQYLGVALPAAIFGMLVVYCLKNTSIFSGAHGLPELIAICAVVGIHLWRRNMLLSIFTGTALYMILIQFVF